jgi:hypothetical protein
MNKAAHMIKQNKGMVLLLVMAFSFVLTTVGTSFIYMYGMQEQFTRAEVNRTRCLYLAEAGLERSMSLLGAGELKTSKPFGGPVIMEPATVANPYQGYFEVEITTVNATLADGSKQYQYIIMSSGTVGNPALGAKFQKTVGATLTPGLLDYIWATGKEPLGGNNLTDRIYLFSGLDEFSGGGYFRSNLQLNSFRTDVFKETDDHQYHIEIRDPIDAGDPPYFYCFEQADSIWLDNNQASLGRKGPTKVDFFKNIKLDELNTMGYLAQTGSQNYWGDVGNITIDGAGKRVLINSTWIPINPSTPVVFIHGNIGNWRPGICTGLNSSTPLQSQCPLVIVSSGSITITGPLNSIRSGGKITGGPLLLIANRSIVISTAIASGAQANLDAYCVARDTFYVANLQEIAGANLYITGGVMMGCRGDVGRANATATSMNTAFGFAKKVVFDPRFMTDPYVSRFFRTGFKKIKRLETPLVVVR